MKLFQTFVLAAVATFMAGPALAKDVCVESSNGVTMKLIKVRATKKEGKMSPLHGTTLRGCPVTGTAYMGSGSVAYFDVVVSCLAIGSPVSRFSWAGDETYAGTGQLDVDGDGTTDGAVTMTALDCTTFVGP